VVVIAADRLGDVVTVVGDAYLGRVPLTSVIESLELLLSRGWLEEETTLTTNSMASKRRRAGFVV